MSTIFAVSAMGCSSADAPAAGSAPAGDAGASLFSQPVDGGGTATPAPIGAYDAGPTVPYDAGPVIAVDAATSVDAGAIPCVAGGEIEAEPNDSATPNPLNGTRCGVVMPGEEDVLQVTGAAFNLAWQGAISVSLSQPTPGGPYLVHITSQTPSVPTYWILGFK